MRLLIVSIVVGSLAVTVAPPTRAQATDAGGLPNDELVCPLAEPLLSPPAWLRAASLDLRGAPPSYEELAAVANADDGNTLVEQMIDEWLASPEFAARAVRRHRELLFNSLGGVDIVNFRATLSPQPGDGILAQTNGASRLLYRGATDRGCRNEPARFNADGSLEVDALGREGYVEVRPYWAPDTLVRVCGLDAQTQAIGERGARCGTSQGVTDRGCGCGEGLRFCVTPDTEAKMKEALVRDVDRRVERNILDDAPYLELLTGRQAHVNGPLAFFWRNLSEITTAPAATPVPLPLDSLPDIPFAAVDEWHVIDAGAGHSGVLTSPAFLFRFQTNRARANRFYNAFLCQPFQPPSDGIDLSDPAAVREPDLQIRNGCKYCHAVLEPAAAHWGRFVEVGAGFLDPATFPRTRPDCEACARSGVGCSAECSRFYVTKAQTESERAYLGQLRGYLFRRSEHERNVEEGPRHLVLASVIDEKLPTCVSRSTAEWLFGRGLAPDERILIEELSAGFVDSGFSYRSLVRAIVTSDVYRRVR